MILLILAVLAGVALFALPHVLLGRVVGHIVERLTGRR